MGHAFIFLPGKWQGTGKISFSMADDVLPFNMTWTVAENEEGIFRFSQTVTVENFDEPLNNHFSLTNVTKNTFTIALENTLVGRVEGKGIFDEKIIAWEFKKAQEGFEGYEIYELQEDGSYKMRAEFMGGDDLRTFVTGTIQLTA